MNVRGIGSECLNYLATFWSQINNNVFKLKFGLLPKKYMYTQKNTYKFKIVHIKNQICPHKKH